MDFSHISSYLLARPFAVAYPLIGITLLDVVVGLAVALKKGEKLDAAKLPQFLETTVAWQVWAAIGAAVVLDYVSRGQGVALVTLAALVAPASVGFIKVLADVKDKIVFLAGV